MNNTTPTTDTQLDAARQAVNYSPAGAPWFLITTADDPTGQWALPTLCSIPAAAGLVCGLCDQPADNHPTITTLHVVDVGPVWSHRSCHDQAVAEMHTATARLCATYGLRQPAWVVTP